MKRMQAFTEANVGNVGDDKKPERVEEFGEKEKVRRAREEKRKEGDERTLAMTAGVGGMMSRDGLDNLEVRGVLKQDQSLEVKAWKAEIKPKLGSELDRLEPPSWRRASSLEDRGMLKSDENLEVNRSQKESGRRRNLSLRSKKQLPTKTQSIDFDGITGTELEKDKSRFCWKKMTVRGTMVRSEVCNSWCFCLES